MIVTQLQNLAQDIGFSHTGELNMDALVCRKDVRRMCEDNRCGCWNARWTCPPAFGDLAHAQKILSRFSRGVLVQSTEALRDPFDLEIMRGAESRHKKRFSTLTRQARQVSPGCLPMGSGACTLCRTCTYPDRPCRWPSRAHPSMEAYGLLISDVLEQSGMSYNYGPGTITYTSCILLL